MSALEKTIWIDAPIDVVFPYLIEEDKMIQWCGVGARLEPVPGGLYELDMGVAGVIVGRFVEVRAPDYLRYEIHPPEGIEGSPSVVEMSLTEEGGGTRINVSHTGLTPPFQSIAGRGWDHHIARLSVAANSGLSGPDSLCERPMDSLI